MKLPNSVLAAHPHFVEIARELAEDKLPDILAADHEPWVQCLAYELQYAFDSWTDQTRRAALQAYQIARQVHRNAAERQR